MHAERLFKVLLVALVFPFLTQTAHAQRGGGEGRVNKLSGPTMSTYFLFYRFPISACQPCSEVPGKQGAIKDKLNYSDTWFWIKLSAGFGRSIANDLDYPDGFDKSTTVKVFALQPAVQFRFPLGKSPDRKAGFVEVDVGYLFNLFYGEAFPAFGRDALDFDVGWKPWDRGDWTRGGGGFKISAVATYYWDGITGEDFGALPGTFEVDSDLVLGVSVSWEFF